MKVSWHQNAKKDKDFKLENTSQSSCFQLLAKLSYREYSVQTFFCCSVCAEGKGKNPVRANSFRHDPSLCAACIANMGLCFAETWIKLTGYPTQPENILTKLSNNEEEMNYPITILG